MPILIAVLLFVSQGAWAKDALLEEKLCKQLLVQKAQPIDYDASDLEGQYFALLEKVQNIKYVSSERMQFYIEEILSMKAYLLNQMGKLVTSVEKPETLRSIYQMLFSLGVPPQNYGLQMDAMGRMVRYRMGPSAQSQSIDQIAEMNPIGFLKNGKAPTRDLPDWQHRTIGFGAQSVELYAPPERATGSIRMDVSPQDPGTLIVVDEEKGVRFEVDMQIMTTSGAEVEGHRYILGFNRDISQWVVIAENLNNPSNRLGF